MTRRSGFGSGSHSVRRVVTLVVVVVASLGLTTASSQAGEDRGQLQLTSIAIPTAVAPTVRDDSFDVERLRARTVDADTSALATADCDGCAATATTLGIAYVDQGRAARLDNVATAWNTCADCSATSISVQVVIVRRSQKVTANNRALAVNAGCAGCHASAAAYQMVVLEPRGKRLSGKDIRQLQSWVADQAQLLAHPAPTALLRSAAPGPQLLDGLEAQLGTSLGPITTLERSADVKTG